MGQRPAATLDPDTGQNIEQAPGNAGRQRSLAPGADDRSLQPVSSSAQHALILFLDQGIEQMGSRSGHVSGGGWIASGLLDGPRQVIHEQGQGLLRLRTKVPGIAQEAGNTVQVGLQIAGCVWW
jgi:hypothetical protein